MRAKLNFAGPSVFGSSVFGQGSNVFGNDSSVFGNIRGYLALPIHIFSGRGYLHTLVIQLLGCPEVTVDGMSVTKIAPNFITFNIQFWLLVNKMQSPC